MRGSDPEVCLDAGISAKTLYNYCKERPEFFRAKRAAQEAFENDGEIDLGAKDRKRRSQHDDVVPEA